MPLPQKGEKKKDFIKRCIPMLINEGRKPGQATAICHSIWDRKSKQEVLMEKYFRSDITYGIEQGKSGIDRENGIIKGFAVVTKGITHDERGEFDEQELDKIIEMGNSDPNGLKSRFGHPNMSGTALGTFLGRVRDFRRDNEIVRADLHIDDTAHNTPQGNLADYVMNLAENDPNAFGASMVINWEPEYRVEKDGTSKKDEKGNSLPPFIRTEKLRSVDIVDDPAANNGMFDFFGNTNVKFSSEMTNFLDRFLEDEDSVQNVIGFLQKYLLNRGYSERLIGKELNNNKNIKKEDTKNMDEKLFTQKEFDIAIEEKTKEMQTKFDEKDGIIAEKDKLLSEKDSIITNKDSVIADMSKTLAEKDNAMIDMSKAIIEKDNTMADMSKTIVEKDKNLEEKDKTIKTLEAEKRVDSKWQELQNDYEIEDADGIKKILLKSELGETLSVQETETLIKKKKGSSLPGNTLPVENKRIFTEERKVELRRFAGIRSKVK